MLLHVLAAIHNTTTLLFGIFLSAFFLRVRQNKSNTIKLLLYSLAEGTVYLLSLTLIGETATMQIYPLFIHLPLALFLTFYYHYTFIFLTICVQNFPICYTPATKLWSSLWASLPVWPILHFYLYISRNTNANSRSANTAI